MGVPSGYSPLLHDVLIKYCNENKISFATLADNAYNEEGELIFPPAKTTDRVSNESALFHLTNNIYSHLLISFLHHHHHHKRWYQKKVQRLREQGGSSTTPRTSAYTPIPTNFDPFSKGFICSKHSKPLTLQLSKMGKGSRSKTPPPTKHTPTKHVQWTTKKTAVDAETIANMATDFANGCSITTNVGNVGEDTAVNQPENMVFNSSFEADDGVVDDTWSFNDQASGQLTKVLTLTVPDKKKNLSMTGYLFKLKLLEINSQTSNAKAILMRNIEGALGIAVFIFSSHERWGVDMEMFMAICQERWGPCEQRNDAFVHIWNNIVKSGKITGTQVYFYELPDQTATYTSVVKDTSGEDNELVSSVFISPGGKFLFYCCMLIVVVSIFITH